MTTGHRFGFVALAGPPNAGKSTLLNRLMQQKLAIISRRPQTTRHRIIGIKTLPQAQVVFVDTPGLQSAANTTLNRTLNRTALNSMTAVDVVVFMLDCRGWNAASRHAFAAVQEQVQAGQPVILVLNKIDTLKDKSALLPLIDASQAVHRFAEIIPLAALKLSAPQQHTFLTTLIKYLPTGSACYPAAQVTDRSNAFLASEFVREQIFRSLGQELPYVSAVEVVKFDDRDADYYKIDAVIWVEKPSQKPIVVGQRGAQLKRIGTQARLQMQRAFATRVFLNLWVKHRKGWADNAKMLQTLGYTDTEWS